MKKHLRIVVKGKVQGVFFRASTKDKADELGIKGIVRNEKDGSVYIEAEGEEEVMKEFVAWCGKGSRAAKVTDVEVSGGDLKNFEGFDIRR